MQTETGYRLEVVTVRKLEFETDGFAFGDKVLARWYPDKAEADKKGILIVVTTGKDGAITGGPAFIQVKDDPDILTGGTIQTFVMFHVTCQTFSGYLEYNAA